MCKVERRDFNYFNFSNTKTKSISGIREGQMGQTDFVSVFADLACLNFCMNAPKLAPQPHLGRGEQHLVLRFGIVRSPSGTKKKKVLRVLIPRATV
jgi:hypothetical protein